MNLPGDDSEYEQEYSFRHAEGTGPSHSQPIENAHDEPSAASIDDIDGLSAEELDLEFPDNLECEEFHALFRELGLDELIISNTEATRALHDEDNNWPPRDTSMATDDSNATFSRIV
jgi:hypothetical protein